MPVDTTKLALDITEAYVHAQAAIKGLKDGGTSCFDHPVIYFDGRVTKKVTEVLEALDLRASRSYGWTKGGLGLHRFPGSNCQGEPRTKGAEAVAKFLEERGWRTTVHYAMD